MNPKAESVRQKQHLPRQLEPREGKIFGRRRTMKKNLKLATKLIIAFLAVGLIPMVGTGLYNYLRGQSFFKDMIFNQNSLYVEQKAKMVQFGPSKESWQSRAFSRCLVFTKMRTA
jgi:hypothetical protein